MKIGTFGTLALALVFTACGSKDNNTPVVTAPANNTSVTTSRDSTASTGTSDNDIIMSNMMNSAAMHTLQYPISTP